jgi:hypothetical protein
LAAFESELQRLRVELKDSQSRLLFRGQTDSGNRLTTTLERKSSKGMSLRDYYFLAVGLIKPAVETFTGVNWDVQEYGDDIDKLFRDPGLLALRRFPSLGHYRYLVYLRHH